MGKLLSMSKVEKGEYDEFIKEHMKALIHQIMQKSRGTENPNVVVERIKKVINNFQLPKKEKKEEWYNDELWDADPNCEHEVYCAPGGGVKCKHCPGWFCY